MPQLCLYFQLHQPYRLNDFTLFDVGRRKDYFESQLVGSNESIFRKVSAKSYLPMLQVLLDLVRQYPEFRFAISLTGVFLEQAQAYEPAVIRLLSDLVRTGQVELLAETYYHSLAALFSPTEFRLQVKHHTQKIQALFGYTPQVFRNTELIFSNEIAHQVRALGFRGLLTEAVPRYLGDRSLTQVFQSYVEPELKLLLKHAQLSDDIAFRFSDKQWQWHPLSAERYHEWLNHYPSEAIINLFMDFETFGEHQWVETGIFDFFRAMVGKVILDTSASFVTPTDVLVKQSPGTRPGYDVPQPISWADVDRDLTAWLENQLQQDTVRILYELEPAVLRSQQPELITAWRRLQTSDHFYYMCTKWAADGDVHAYFSPYKSPWEAYRRYSVVLADVQERLSNL